MAEDDARTELEHKFLDHAKSFEWQEVKTMLEATPDLINVQPAGRWTALHQAAFSGSREMAEWLVGQGSDAKLLTHARKTPPQVAKGAAKEYLAGAAERGAAEEQPAAEAAAAPEAEAAPAAVAAAPAAAAPAEDGTPKKKKAKVDPVYSLNINGAVDKEFEGCSFKDVAKAPTSALQGIGEKGRLALRKLGVKTIKDLGTWKYYKVAKAIVGLSALEEPGKREEGAAMNINKALVKKHEVDPLQDIVKLPPSALQGLAAWTDMELASLHIKTIAQLGEWKFARWAEWIVDLAEFESADFSS